MFLTFCCRRASRLYFYQLTRSHNAACVHTMAAARPAEATLLVLTSQAGQLCLHRLGPDGEYVLLGAEHTPRNRTD